MSKIPFPGTEITIQLPLPQDYALKPENIALEILYEDSDIIFINKPAGMVVHPAAGHWQGTLVHALLYHFPNIFNIGHENRPGIVHRLDKGTSGVMVVAKTQMAMQNLVTTFQAHNLKRQYIALAMGRPSVPTGTIKTFFGRSTQDRKKMSCSLKTGKEAITHYRLLQYVAPLAHYELTLETGRTHQIRVHLSQALKTPILLDDLYSNPVQQKKKLSSEILRIIDNYAYPLLHAQFLGLHHPITGNWMEFSVPAPSPFLDLLRLLDHHK